MVFLWRGGKETIQFLRLDITYFISFKSQSATHIKSSSFFHIQEVVQLQNKMGKKMSQETIIKFTWYHGAIVTSFECENMIFDISRAA